MTADISMSLLIAFAGYVSGEFRTRRKANHRGCQVDRGIVNSPLVGYTVQFKKGTVSIIYFNLNFCHLAGTLKQTSW